MPARETPDLESRRAYIREVWPLGWSMGEIGRQLGVTRSSVAGMVSRMGLARRPTQISLPKPMSVPKPLPPTPPEPAPGTLGLEDLLTGMCRWPTGHGASVRFCGLPVGKGPYCLGHAAIAFQKPLARTR
jgi:hypothetical protein